MSCAHSRKRSVLGREGGDGKPIYGMPPASEQEPAWCQDCGALWCKTAMGWGWLAPRSDRSATTIGNLIANKREADGVVKIAFEIVVAGGRRVQSQFIRSNKIAELLGATESLGSYLRELVAHARRAPGEPEMTRH